MRSPRLLVLLALFGSCWGCGSAQEGASSTLEKPPETAAAAELTPLGARAPGEPESPLPVEADDIATGEAGAPVTVVAFLDFECHFCAQGFRTLDELRLRYSEKQLRIVLKQLPLDFHPLALPGAVAAQAVQLASGPRVGMDYARLLFQNQAGLGYTEFAGFAAQAGVPRELYNELVADPDTVRRVASDVVLARRHGVDGTPAFFVNGHLLSGAQPLESFVTLIDEEQRLIGERQKTESWAEAYGTRVRENTQRSLADAILARDPGVYRVPVDGSPVFGPVDAPLTLVLFTDFECPFCKRVEPTLAELKRLYAGKLRLVFKQKPLPSHPHALPAARLTTAIFLKKGNAEFFAAAAEVFESAPELDDARLLAVGVRHGLSEAEAKLALSGENSAVNERILRDGYLADDVEADGTPHIFINGRRLGGARPLTHFRALAELELERAQARLAQGVVPAQLYETLQEGALSPGAPQAVTQIPSDAKRPSRGPARAPVTIHIFSDFECPYCRRAEEVLTELDRAHPEQLRFVWHDLPLDFHAHALPAARAGREAFDQKGNAGFWKMHGLLFGLDEEKPALGREDLVGYGRELGLDAAAFSRALDAPDKPASLVADEASAAELGIRGTPAFVIGRYLLSGARPLAHFERVVRLVLLETAGKR